MINLKNKSAVILNPERSEWVSRSHVTGVEPVVNDGAKTQCYSAKRDLYGPSLRSTLKMTVLAFLLFINISESRADSCTCSWGGADNKTLTISNCPNGALSSSACSDQKTANNVVVGTGVTRIGSNAFDSASSLTSITIPDSVTSIGDQAFYNASGLTSITIPDSVTSIGQNAFQGASSLTSITIPEGVTSIGSYTFANASSLTSITIPEGVTSIGAGAFQNDSSLTSITIPEGVTSIGSSAFAGASSLTSITLPDSVTSIGSGAFFAASSLNNIMCKGDETSCAATVAQIRNAGYTGDISYPPQEADNGNTGGDDTGGDDVGDISGDFNPADCYNKGQVPYNNQCWNEYPFAKKRWTPAEASKWLHDGNDNFVVITFKK